VIRISSDNAERYNVPVLMQKGVFVERPGASSLMDFIASLFNLTPEAVLDEIRTIMIDNSVVDDPESVQVQNANTLVLSGAMPGLVGAMLRSESPYKAMRATITNEGKVTDSAPMILVKLFNTVLKNHIHDMIEHGFWIPDDGS
jgi:hypothetical protein